MQQSSKSNPLLVVLIVVGLLSGAGAGTAYVLKSDDASSTFVINTSGHNQKDDDTSVKHFTYTDGTYSEKANYISPGGKEGVQVKVTLKDNKISSATFTPRPNSITAGQYQADFKSGYKTKVVGKNIDDVKLSRVAGSSLTSNGFNDAIAKIRDDAKA